MLTICKFLNNTLKMKTARTIHPHIKKLVGKKQFQDFLSRKRKNYRFKATHFRIFSMVSKC